MTTKSKKKALNGKTIKKSTGRQKTVASRTWARCFFSVSFFLFFSVFVARQRKKKALAATKLFFLYLSWNKRRRNGRTGMRQPKIKKNNHNIEDNEKPLYIIRSLNGVLRKQFDCMAKLMVLSNKHQDFPSTAPPPPKKKVETHEKSSRTWARVAMVIPLKWPHKMASGCGGGGGATFSKSPIFKDFY